MSSPISLAELRAEVALLQGELFSLMGPAVVYRCGVCKRLASEHIGCVVTGCVTDEGPEDLERHSLTLQRHSCIEALQRLRSASAQAAQVTDLTAKVVGLLDEVRDLERTDTERKVELKRVEQELAQSRDEQVSDAVERSADMLQLNDYWKSLTSGDLSVGVFKEYVEKDFKISLPSTFKFGSLSHPHETTDDRASTGLSDDSSKAADTAAKTAAASADAGAGAASRGAADAKGSAGAAASSSKSSAPNGDTVAKSNKTIKVSFTGKDTACEHLQTEQSLFNEVDLLYPDANERTKISIIISHCDTDIKGVAIAVRNTHNPATVDAFFKLFRNER